MGDVAQMAEGMLSMHEARGSIPRFRIIFGQNYYFWFNLNRHPPHNKQQVQNFEKKLEKKKNMTFIIKISVGSY